MRLLLAAPANNDRGPRYMERALAAVHQAQIGDQPIVLEYGGLQNQVGLFLGFPNAIENVVTNAILANYPNCTLRRVEANGPAPQRRCEWIAKLTLRPELFPILRHAQFEDLLNGTFADPIANLLRAITPDPYVDCRIEITITRAPHGQCHRAVRAVKCLDREFFHQHHRLARHYASRIMHRRGRLFALTLGVLARCTSRRSHTTLDTSTSRLHEREEDLQAAADKVGGHLFATRIRLIASAEPQHRSAARDRLRQMAGAFGAFTKSRLATFHPGQIHQGSLADHRANVSSCRMRSLRLSSIRRRRPSAPSG